MNTGFRKSLRAVLAGSLLFGGVAVASVIAGSLLTASPASAQGTWAQATEITAPANAGTDPEAQFVGVSCWSAGNCTAAGYYTDSSGNGQAMAATETSGTWAQATEITAPANAGTNPGATLYGVSCSSAGNCTATGFYTDSSGNRQAMAATETSGTWAQATEITLPANAGTNPGATLYGVSCSSAGNCTATGSYTDSSGNRQAMAATETSGTTDTVTFVSDGGAPVSSMRGPDGSSITLPSDGYPGHSFHGWFTASSGGTKVGGAGSSYTIPPGGSTLYAHWTAIRPAITKISPTSGPPAGGTKVTITGSGFTGATKVVFGGVAARSFTVVSSTKITAVSPAHAASTLNIHVTSPGGTSAQTAADQFRYT
jgi:uncharacterized repeat protein (TIGR02543 family)